MKLSPGSPSNSIAPSDPVAAKFVALNPPPAPLYAIVFAVGEIVALDVTVNAVLLDWFAVASIDPDKPRPDVLPSICPLFTVGISEDCTNPLTVIFDAPSLLVKVNVPPDKLPPFTNVSAVDTAVNDKPPLPLVVNTSPLLPSETFNSSTPIELFVTAIETPVAFAVVEIALPPWKSTTSVDVILSLEPESACNIQCP